MYKEMIISIILVALIVAGDLITQNYTKKTVTTLIEELEVLKQSLSQNIEEQANDELEKLNEKWEEVHDKLAYYIEHDELEKVENNLTSCRSLTKTGNFDLAINEVEKMAFVLNHITDKYSFNFDIILEYFSIPFCLLFIIQNHRTNFGYSSSSLGYYYIIFFYIIF